MPPHPHSRSKRRGNQLASLKKKVKTRSNPAKQATGDRKHHQPERPQKCVLLLRAGSLVAPDWSTANQFSGVCLFFQEAEKKHAEGLQCNRAGRGTGLSAPSLHPRAHRTPSSADIHLAGQMQTKANKPKRGEKEKENPKSRKIRVYNYVHKKSGFRRLFARNRVYVDRGWVG